MKNIWNHRGRKNRAGPRGVVEGGGGTESGRLELRDESRERGESMRGGSHWRGIGGSPPEFF